MQKGFSFICLKLNETNLLAKSERVKLRQVQRARREGKSKRERETDNVACEIGQTHCIFTYGQSLFVLQRKKKEIG